MATQRVPAKKTGHSKRLKLHCYFCGGLLLSDNAHFEIYDRELPPFHSEHVRFNKHGGKELYGDLAYPGNGESIVQQGEWRSYERVVLFTHTKCGPDNVSYHFSFDRLGENWEQHLSEKGWWSPSILEALTVARKVMKE